MVLCNIRQFHHIMHCLYLIVFKNRPDECQNIDYYTFNINRNITSYGLLEISDGLTRVTENGSSRIDYVITSIPLNDNHLVKNIESHLSGYTAEFFMINNTECKREPHKGM